MPVSDAARKAVIAASIDLNGGAGCFNLFTCAYEPVILAGITVRMPKYDEALGLSTLSIHTDGSTPYVFIRQVDGIAEHLTSEAQLTWCPPGPGYMAIITPGANVQMTIDGVSLAHPCICDVSVSYWPAEEGGELHANK